MIWKSDLKVEIDALRRRVDFLTEELWKVNNPPRKVGDRVCFKYCNDGGEFVEPIYGNIGSVKYDKYEWEYGVVVDGKIYYTNYVTK